MLMIYSLLLAVLFSSCGFSSQDKGFEGHAPASFSSNVDSDGDMISDSKEKEKGTNPLVANIPQVKIDFLKDYKIVVKYKSKQELREKQFVIDTKGEEGAPLVRYQTNEAFMKKKSLVEAATVAKYNSHIWGEIGPFDFSWASLPAVPPKTLSEQVLRYQHFFDADYYEITGIEITLENSVKLVENLGFSHIKNLKLNFRYFDYEKDTHTIVSSVRFDNQINQGVIENFQIKIEDAPISLIRDNYLIRGEFLILEIDDYEIPELGTNYKTLLNSVRNKSIPVVMNTPAESVVQYVGIQEDKKRFQHILETLFDEDYLIERGELKKIGQFETNLPSYEYLNNLEREDKKGKWFVFTNQITGHYLNHLYTPDDTLALTYATGTDLATQTASREIRYHYAESDDLNHYSLGNASAHSVVHIQIKPRVRWGTAKRREKFNNFLNSEYRCYIDIYRFEEIREPLKLTTDAYDLEGQMDSGSVSKGVLLTNGNYLVEDFSNIKLIVGEEEFSFRQLMDEDKIFFEEVEGGHIHFTLAGLDRIVEMEDGEERPISIKLQEIEETTSSGIRLSSMSGKFGFLCPSKTLDLARSAGIPFSLDSAGKHQWENALRRTSIPHSEKRTYRQYFSIESSSTIVNYHN